MRRWFLCLAALILIAVVGGPALKRSDVGSLQPVELIRLSSQNGWVLAETDTGEAGMGRTAAEAFDDLQESSARTVFLETADYLLLGHGGEELIPQVRQMLRPGCMLCLDAGNADLAAAAEYLSAHLAEQTILDYAAGERELPVLITSGGRMHLVKGR